MFGVLLQLIFASAILATPLPRQSDPKRQYTIYNKCPTSINLYIGGASHGIIPTNGSVSETLSTNTGYFYTDANGGNENGKNSIRAGFYNDFYYLISGKEHANTGLQLKPKNPTPANNSDFCQTVQCDDLGCQEGYLEPPVSFPDPKPYPPSAPLYQCPVENTDFDIIFCPTGNFPDRGQEIRFDDTLGECLTVQGGVFANGTPVQIGQCSGSKAQLWMIQRGSTKVKLANTNFCLDAGADPANGNQLKIWECYDNLPAQQWNYTPDNRIALENQGFCMDLDNGILTTNYKVQTWTCSDNNENQVWKL